MRKKEGNTQDAGKEFLQAVEFVEKEKGIKKEDILAFMEQALNAAYKKNYGIPGKVVINPDTGSIKVFSFKTVVPDEKVGMDYDDLNENPELDENGRTNRSTRIRTRNRNYIERCIKKSTQMFK